MIPFGTSSITLKTLDAAAMGCMVVTSAPQVTLYPLNTPQHSLTLTSTPSITLSNILLTHTLQHTF